MNRLIFLTILIVAAVYFLRRKEVPGSTEEEKPKWKFDPTKFGYDPNRILAPNNNGNMTPAPAPSPVIVVNTGGNEPLQAGGNCASMGPAYYFDDASGKCLKKDVPPTIPQELPTSSTTLQIDPKSLFTQITDNPINLIKALP